MIATPQKPKHPKTNYYLQHKLFDGLSTFADLEQRIAGLPSKHERGDAFEVFAEAYLATQPLYQAKTVWPFAALPLAIKNRFALGISDFGVDGVFETHLGEFHAYQAKFRTGRPSLTWNELSTFLGLTDQIAARVVISNCDSLSEVLADRRGFYAIRGCNLDRLQAEDFEVIHQWLAGAIVEHKRKTPLPRQQEVIDAVVLSIQEHDRATILMPCGTGKTLVALWIAEYLESKTILVLVPSLALMSQTLHEWMKETRWNSPSFLCVCSDPSVTSHADALVLHQSELDFPVTTDSAAVRSFLDRKIHGVKVICSTYQSAHVIAAGMVERERFDVGIFDEAHKTFGREDGSFAFGLKDANLSITKRLFMTATPRHYDISKRDKNGDAELIYSMDAPETYGPVAYRMSFAQAVREGLICGYKVIISVVTNEMVHDALLRRGTVAVGTDEVRARQVANQLAVQDTVQRYGIGKIITFHKSVAAAQSFVSEGIEGIGKHMPELQTFHVNGAMPSAMREAVMHEFASGPCTLISNARCLTEGVDVPAVDMVAFLAPRRSLVDIVQATGRAMRKSDRTNKTTGYVLVPLFLEQGTGESIEAAIARGRFDEVWSVLQALQEHDDVLAHIIREMRTNTGQAIGYDDLTFQEKVVINGPIVLLDALRKAITTRIVDVTVSDYEDSWDEMFQQLSTFQKVHGHCRVPLNPKYRVLWRWLYRQQFAAYRLSHEQKRRLESIHFPWTGDELLRQESEVNQAREFEYHFALVQSFVERHGHCFISDECPGINDPTEVSAAWIRGAKKNDGLTDSQTRSLNDVGFVWNSKEAMWMQEIFTRVGELKTFKQKHGHFNVPWNWNENPALASWVNKSRTIKAGIYGHPYKEILLQHLNAIGFDWDSWESMYLGCVQYKNQNGFLWRPPRLAREERELFNWLETQHFKWGTNQLSNIEVQKLEQLGLRKDHDEERLVALEDFVHQNGHGNITEHQHPLLFRWLKEKRKDRKALPEHLWKRLDEILKLV